MKTVIWDYNGTILNDAQISVDIENEMLERRHLKAGYTLEMYRNLYNIPMVDYYKKLGYTFENESFEEVGKEFYSLYDKHFDECGLNEGVLDKLQDAIQKGYQNVILSSCAHDLLVKQCKSLQIDKFFVDIVGVDNLVGGSKVENGKALLKKLDVNVDECVYIGDTNADYHTACSLNIKNIYLVAQGHQSYQRLKELHSNTVYSVKEVIL